MKNLFISIVLLGLSCAEAAACSCQVKSFDQYVNDADAVYFATLEEARVVRNDPDQKWPFIQARFDVRRTVKGVKRTGDMMLYTGLGGGDCGLAMAVSETYLIFKSAKSDAIGDCGGSQVVYRFEEDAIAAKVKAAMKKRPLKK